MNNEMWTIIGSAIGVIGFIYIFLRNFKADMLSSFSKVESRIEKLDEKVTDIDRRLCRLEGAFTQKDCCVLKQDQNLRKAE